MSEKQDTASSNEWKTADKHEPIKAMHYAS